MSNQCGSRCGGEDTLRVLNYRLRGNNRLLALAALGDCLEKHYL